MFERFTERARQVVALAQEESRTLKHAHVGTEHLLLGLLRERDSFAADVLGSFDVTLERFRGEVVRTVGIGQEATSGQVPFTPQAKQALERSLDEARELGHNYIGTEHILLGLLSAADGRSERMLRDCHAEPDQIRQAVIQKLPKPAPAPRASTGAPPPSGNGFEEWIRVGPGSGVRRLLMSAAARALDEGREDIQARDVLLALVRDEQAGPLLADLGVDDMAIRRALERRRHTEPPRAPAES